MPVTALTTMGSSSFFVIEVHDRFILINWNAEIEFQRIATTGRRCSRGRWKDATEQCWGKDELKY